MSQYWDPICRCMEFSQIPVFGQILVARGDNCALFYTDVHVTSFTLLLTIIFTTCKGSLRQGNIFRSMCLDAWSHVPSGGCLCLSPHVPSGGGWRSLSRGTSVQGVSIQGGLCLGVSILGDLCPGVSVLGALCLGRSLSRNLCPKEGVSGRETPGQRQPIQWRTSNTHPTEMLSCLSLN